MSKEEAIAQLLECQSANAAASGEQFAADRILCQFLISLGYADVVAEYEKVEKWYA